MSVKPSKFVNHMLWHTFEASQLCSFEGEDSIDRDSKCGPWRPSDCSAALLRWLDAGMIHCEASIGWGPDSPEREDVVEPYPTAWLERSKIVNSYYIFAARDSRTVLADPASWRYPGVGWFMQVNVVPEHFNTSDEEWIAALSGMPADLL